MLVQPKLFYLANDKNTELHQNFQSGNIAYYNTQSLLVHLGTEHIPCASYITLFARRYGDRCVTTSLWHHSTSNGCTSAVA